MIEPPLYPLRFEPIFRSMPWGGRRLPGFLNRPHPTDDPVGEAWVLSDVDGYPSRVADGPLAGVTLRELLAADPARVLRRAPLINGRFPVLLKFIDARQALSVQVHPNDEQAARVTPGGNGKTEAWVVLAANPETSRIYAGFRHGITAERFRTALAARSVPGTLHSFTPRPGDCVFLEAGTVHAIGADILLFEIQQTCDITYRLYDWDRVDVKTGTPRQLNVVEGLACSDFTRGPCYPVRPAAEVEPGGRREGLVSCRYFGIERQTRSMPFALGAAGECRAVVCASGSGELRWADARYPLSPGDVVVLPAEVGECLCVPAVELTVLECGLPG